MQQNCLINTVQNQTEILLEPLSCLLNCVCLLWNLRIPVFILGSWKQQRWLMWRPTWRKPKFHVSPKLCSEKGRTILRAFRLSHFMGKGKDSGSCHKVGKSLEGTVLDSLTPSPHLSYDPPHCNKILYAWIHIHHALEKVPEHLSSPLSLWLTAKALDANPSMKVLQPSSSPLLLWSLLPYIFCGFLFLTCLLKLSFSPLCPQSSFTLRHTMPGWPHTHPLSYTL